MESRDKAFEFLLEEKEPIDVEVLLNRFRRADKYRNAKKNGNAFYKRYSKHPDEGSTVPTKSPSQTHDNIQNIICSVIKKIKRNNPHIILTAEDIAQYANGPAAIILLQQFATAFSSQYPAIPARYDPVLQQVQVGK